MLGSYTTTTGTLTAGGYYAAIGYSSPYNAYPTRQSWQCGGCKRWNAPFVDTCPCYGCTPYYPPGQPYWYVEPTLMPFNPNATIVYGASWTSDGTGGRDEPEITVWGNAKNASNQSGGTFEPADTGRV